MKTLTFVWGFVAFSILGLEFLLKTETFDALQDFESNFNLVSHPEEFLPYWSANDVRAGSSRVFQATGEGINGSKALGIQVIGSFNAEIYTKTTTKDLDSNIISLKVKTKQNGSGNRGVSLFYSFSIDEGANFSLRQQIGDDLTFKNSDSPYQEFDFPIPEVYLERELLTVKLEVLYGEGNGTAPRLFIDDFRLHGLEAAPSADPLEILSLNAAEGNVLIVEFNQPIDIPTENPTASFHLNQGYGHPDGISVKGQSLFLEFSDYLYSNLYELSVDQLVSVTTNERWEGMVHDFELTTPTPPGTILISEFMPDPNPKGLTPENPVLPRDTSNEYVELYNAGSKPVWLKGFSYNQGLVEAFVLLPGGFVLITSTANRGLFSSYGEVIGGDPFRALPNSTGYISITDAYGNVVDSLTYSPDWYGTPEKQSGGWALERINPYLPCSDSDNWTASLSSMGGTPGGVNSVFEDSPDGRPFIVAKVHAVSSREIAVTFSKPFLAQAHQEAIYQLNGSMLYGSMQAPKALFLTVPFDLVSGKQYELEIKNLFDCSGMPIQEQPHAFLYDSEGPVISRIASVARDELIVIFNEALKPSATSIVANYQINGEMDKVQSALLADSISVRLILKDPLELDQNHFLLVRQLEDERGNISAELKSEFFLDDYLDTVIWRGSSLLDLHLGVDIGKMSASQVGNYTVDRNIGEPKNAFRDAENPRLVHLVFDQDLPQNTLGTVTVQNLKNDSGQYINTHKKTFLFDNRPIAIAALHVLNDSTLDVVFNKAMHPDFVSINTNYTINKGIGHPVSVAHLSPERMRIVFEPLIEGENYTLSVAGLQDAFGINMPRAIHRDFDFDFSGPFIVEAVLINPFELKLKANEAIQLPANHAIHISRQEADGVNLVSDREFIVTSRYILTENTILILLEELKDLAGNRSDSILTEVDNRSMRLGELVVVDENRIQLVFTALLDPATSLLASKFRINGQTPKEVDIGQNGFEAMLTSSQPFLLKDSIAIEIFELKSQEGKETGSLLTKTWYDDQIEEVYVKNSQLIQVLHQLALDKASAEGGLFSLIDQFIEVEPLVNQSDPKLLQLILSEALIANQSYELRLPPRRSKDGLSIAGSTRTINHDQSPPEVILIESLNENEILVSFDEALDPVLSLITSYYSLGGEEPIEVIPGTLPHQMILKFGVILEKGKSYELKIIKLEDLNGNAIAAVDVEFVFEGPISPSYRELIINEVMAAPRTGQGLPDTEYVELFNASQHELFLGGLSLANSRSSTILPRASLLPGEFLILVPASRRGEMAEYGTALGLTNWPTLLNEGDELRILDRNGNIIDELIYHVSLYGSSHIAEGGFSLEVVDPYALCSDYDNLKPSEASLRGTPGQDNSVFDDSPDAILPSLLKAEAKEDKTIILDFSKTINSELNQVQIQISPPLSPESFAIDPADGKRLILSFANPLEENIPYNITVTNLWDCAGNLIDPQANAAILVLPLLAAPGDLAINEILFNPKAGVPKFVEIYNQSSKFVDLAGWKLANIADGELANRRAVASERLIMDPFSFLVFTTDAVLLQQAYPKGKLDRFIELPSLPSYPIARGSVVFLDPEEDLEERFDYDEKFHHSLLDEVRGISLERLSLHHGVNDPKNWQSASGNATPGYKNSHAQGEGLLEKEINIFPQVFVPDAPGEQNFTTISYEMDHPGLVATLRIYNIAGQLIKEICQNDIWGISGFYTWDGTNLSGGKVRPGYYIVWLEVLDIEGKVENIKKTVVVGSKF